MTTETQAIAEFILARIADTIADARQVQAAAVSRGQSPNDPSEPKLRLARQVIADCAAKRAIVEEYTGEVRRGPAGQRDDLVARHGGVIDAYGVAIRFLVAPYADHPEYRSEWAP